MPVSVAVSGDMWWKAMSCFRILNDLMHCFHIRNNPLIRRENDPPPISTTRTLPGRLCRPTCVLTTVTDLKIFAKLIIQECVKARAGSSRSVERLKIIRSKSDACTPKEPSPLFRLTRMPKWYPYSLTQTTRGLCAASLERCRGSPRSFVILI